MNVLFINEVCGITSTGRICTDLAERMESEGFNVKIAYGRSGVVPEKYKKYAVRIGNSFDCCMHALQTRLFDTHGFGSKAATKKFLQWAEEYKPDLLWLHNIHGYYINVELLFEWIKQHPEMEVRWTLHDCWAFTGHCSHFTVVNCNQWKTKCKDCVQKEQYPKCIGLSNVEKNFERKRKAFTGVKKMTLITPSKWLADLTRQSFLREYPVEVHYNTIDKTVFKPIPSDFRHRYSLENKIIILGVANVWNERKGLNDFYRLAGILDDKYAIVLVGLNKKQLAALPNNILGIMRTNSPQELAAIYTSADILFNPTYEDNYPTVNLEAEACGTRVVTYDAGGSKETLHDVRSVAIPVGEYKKVLDYLE